MSTELDYTDDELYDEFEEEDMQEERPAGAGAFRFVSVLLFLIAVAGLFIGMIPALESSITTGEGTWSGSLFAAILETFKGLFGLEHATTDFNLLDPLSSSQYPYTYGIGKIAEYLPYVIAGAVVVSLVTMIVSFASAKAAKGSAYTGGVIILLAYGFFFAFLFAARSYFGLTGLRAITDLPSAIIVGAVVIVLAISSIALKKGYGLANSICVLLAIVAIVAFLYPGETVIADIRQVLLFEDGASIAKTVILLGMSAVLALNLLISIFRFAANFWRFALFSPAFPKLSQFHRFGKIKIFLRFPSENPRQSQKRKKTGKTIPSPSRMKLPRKRRKRKKLPQLQKLLPLRRPLRYLPLLRRPLPNPR